MPRALPPAALTIAALIAAAAPAHAQERLPASVSVLHCSFERHSAAFYARMSLVDGAERMALRFRLLVRTGDEGFRTVRAPGLRRWRWSRPGVEALRYRQGVRNLSENATYRMRVDYRWYSANGDVLERTRRRSAACPQFLVPPNLTVSIAGMRATNVPGVARYELFVANLGRAEAEDVPVRLTVDGKVVDTRRVSLGPRTARTVVIRGPVCTQRAVAEVDPDGEVAETSEADNLDELSCS